MIAKVAIARSCSYTDKLYDYLIPEHMEDKAVVGAYVRVPFGKSNSAERGYIMALKSSSTKSLKQIAAVEDCGSMFNEKTVQLIEWMRGKYLCSYMDIIRAVVPAAGRKIENKTVRMVELEILPEEAAEESRRLASKAPVQSRMLELLSSQINVSTADLAAFANGSSSAVNALAAKGYISINEKIVFRSPLTDEDVPKDTPPELTAEQQAAFDRIKESMDKEENTEFLLHGVTGSGKTEVFMRAIDEALKKGKQAIMLVPEISLTPQMLRRFRARFGKRLAVFHSGLSLGERYDEWMRMRNGDADIVIGARSAVFAPFDNIGIIIIDEEHSETYKSELSPRYQTKDVASIRARQYNSALILASATPLIEDYHKALSGGYELLELKTRANKKEMPAVTVADMRKELVNGNRSMFSELLKEEISRNLDNKEQTILLLNRRGFSTFVSCRSCGYVAECPRCSISLTYHRYDDSLRCHYCGYSEPNPHICPSCGSKYIRHFGGGTQRVEEEIHGLFPNASVIRMDVDTTSAKNSHEKLLKKFSREKIDIMIGTQMVAKGLDFENVTLVGVISADTILHMDDYRSSERTFQLLEQVTGRAGRGKKSGRAVIQTYSPESAAVELTKTHDYKGFYEIENSVRRAMEYPPYSEIVGVLFSHASKTLVMQTARYFNRCLDDLRSSDIFVRIMGPIESRINKINNKYRWQLLIKCADSDRLNEYLLNAQQMCREHRLYNDVAVVIDKSPNSVY